MRWRFRGGILRVQRERERGGEESVCRLEFGEGEEEEQCLPLLGPSEVWSQVDQRFLPECSPTHPSVSDVYSLRTCTTFPKSGLCEYFDPVV